MDEFNIDQIQRNIANRLVQENRMDKTIEVMTIIQSIVPDAKGRISKEAILLEARYHNLTEAEVEATLEELARSRTIRMQEDDVIF